MVTKVDRAEAFADFQQTLYSDTGLALISIMAIVSVGFAWARQERIRRLQADLLAGRQEQEHLRQSEERFWVALQNSPVVVFNQDRELRYTWINQPIEPWSEGYLGKTDEEIIGIADGSRLTALKRPVLETGIGARKEWSFVYRGQERVFDINIQPLRNREGDVIGITCASTEITERKRAEEHLRVYERVFEGLQEMIVVLDRSYRYLIANRAFLNYRGLQREQLIGGRVADAISPAVFENIVKPKLDECLRGKIVTFETKYTFPRQGERDLFFSYFPIFGQNGVDRIACVVEDITARKQAEERLREYEKVVEGVEEMIVVIDSEYRYLIANRAFLNYRGLKREDLIGRSIAEVVRPGVFENFLKPKLDECFQGRIVTFEMTYDYPRLGVRNLLVSYFPVEGPNGVERVVCLLHDVTDRKRAEQAVRESETRYRLLFEHNPAGMFRSTLDGKLLEANDAFAHIYGYASRSELLLLPDTRFYMRPEERAPLIARLRQEQALRDYEFCGRHRDGREVWVLANARLAPGEGGSPDLLEGTFIDITARKNAERALHHSETQLRAFIENAPYGIFTCANDHFVTANPALVRMLGYNTEAEVMALHVSTGVFGHGADAATCWNCPVSEIPSAPWKRNGNAATGAPFWFA
jgi:PAS domain S-box-containing protein